MEINMSSKNCQIELEKEMLDLGEKKFRDSLSDNEFESPHIQKIVKDMIVPFSEAIEASLENEAKTRGGGGPLPPLMKLFNKEAFINPATKKVKDDVKSLDRTFTPLQISYIVIRGIFTCLREDDRKRVVSAATHIGKTINSNILRDQQYTKETELIRVGTLLIQELITHFPKWFVTEENAAGVHTAPYTFFDRDCKNKEYIIIPSEKFIEYCEGVIEGIAEMSAVIYPMIYKPAEWSEFGKGGGFYSEQLKKNIIKGKHINDTTGVNVDIVNAVNNIQSTPWVVNDDVLDVIDGLNSSDTSLLDGKIEKTFPKKLEDAPERPFTEDLKYADMDDEQKKDHQLWSRRVKKLNKDIQAKKSVNLSRESAIIQAKMFSKHDEIYFPHDLDYRDR